MKRGDVFLTETGWWGGARNVIGYLGPAQTALLADEKGNCIGDLIEEVREKITYFVYSPNISKLKLKKDLKENTIRIIFESLK